MHFRRRRRILFFAEGITMTHFTRPMALAECLDPEEYEIHFWTPRRFHPLIRQKHLRVGDLQTIDPAQFIQALAAGKPLYTREALRRYVRDDLAIIDQTRPDLIVGDFRLSLTISAPLSHVPFASIFNAHWSPHYEQPAVVPQIPLTRWLPLSLLTRVFSVLRPAVYAAFARPVNQLRREFNLPAISDDLRAIYTAGDLTLYPDIPEFVPLSGAPGHHHFIGPCAWSAPVAKPVWWDEVMSLPRPKIFISLGSSGPVNTLPAILKAVARLPVCVILATSGRFPASTAPNVFTADLLPYEETARHCAFVVSHGGTGGLYPALCAGTPMLGIPSNFDSHLSAALLEKSGAGLSIRAESASEHNLYRAMEALLQNPSFKQRARDWSRAFGRYDSTRLFPEILNRWFSNNVSTQSEHLSKSSIAVDRLGNLTPVFARGIRS
jgi:UDP:flavonoid glycosyltransferase YjiC (YdhE family)